MSGDAAEAGAGAGGCCAVVFYTIFAPFCNTKSWGSGGSNGVAGCCGSCCNRSFNEDSMDKWDGIKRDGEGQGGEKQTQPGPTAAMAMPAKTEGAVADS
ncbi:hypothetical protein MIND_00980200 [Mycena indigotica]|uniref:Uncharacterized protein n=1 Tax=Mycena indigotica TaxID=2126181 RepID=A0A8H6SEU2_9AGAR|nr:uncharacterized protein MIND_00980200 [Mycena indigotica]KAF7297465.1 hypothetical protein MIND_00980200 [Mycena indigotica]